MSMIGIADAISRHDMPTAFDTKLPFFRNLVQCLFYPKSQILMHTNVERKKVATWPFMAQWSAFKDACSRYEMPYSANDVWE
jgi:hypothetical protein